MKLGIALCVIFLTTCAAEKQELLKIYELNGCKLKYKKYVPDKPEIFVTTKKVSGICRLQNNQNESTENYEAMEIKYYNGTISYETHDQIAPIIPDTNQIYKQTSYQGLSYDTFTKSLIYSDNVVDDQNNYDTVIERRLNDYQLIRKSFLRHRYWIEVLLLSVEDLAYDWNTRNVYVKYKDAIVVKNLNKFWQPIQLISGTWISSLAIHPKAGYLFYIEVDRVDVRSEVRRRIEYMFLRPSKYGYPHTHRGPLHHRRILHNYTKIYRTYLDGSNKFQIGPSEDYQTCQIDNLVIDYHTDRLYWSIPFENLVQSSNLDGTDVKDVIHHSLDYVNTNHYPRSLSFDKKFIYYYLQNQKIYRVDKESLKEDDDFEITNEAEGGGVINGIMVYDSETHQSVSDHPCAVNNGGCPEYCFILPKNQTEKKHHRICRNA